MQREKNDFENSTWRKGCVDKRGRYRIRCQAKTSCQEHMHLKTSPLWPARSGTHISKSPTVCGCHAHHCFSTHPSSLSPASLQPQNVTPSAVSLLTCVLVNTHMLWGERVKNTVYPAIGVVSGIDAWLLWPTPDQIRPPPVCAVSPYHCPALPGLPTKAVNSLQHFNPTHRWLIMA